MANHEVLELQIAKEILAEVFHARSIRRRRWTQRRLEEWSWCEKYRAGCDLPCYAWVSRYWTDVSRERENGRKGCLCQVAEDQTLIREELALLCSIFERWTGQCSYCLYFVELDQLRFYP
jgi:hypothetical protein